MCKSKVKVFPKKVVICAAVSVARVSVSCSNQNKHGDRAEDWPGTGHRATTLRTNITLARHYSLQSRVMKLQSSLLVRDGSGCCDDRGVLVGQSIGPSHAGVYCLDIYTIYYLLYLDIYTIYYLHYLLSTLVMDGRQAGAHQSPPPCAVLGADVFMNMNHITATYRHLAPAGHTSDNE